MLKKIIMIGIIFSGISNVSNAAIEYNHIASPVSTGEVDKGYNGKPLYVIGDTYRPGELIAGASLVITGVVDMTESDPEATTNILSRGTEGMETITETGGVAIKFAENSNTITEAVPGISLENSKIQYNIEFPDAQLPTNPNIVYTIDGSAVAADPGFSYKKIRVKYEITLNVTGRAPSEMVLARGNIKGGESIYVEDLVKRFMFEHSGI